jgi:hypothetical protein
MSARLGKLTLILAIGFAVFTTQSAFAQGNNNGLGIFQGSVGGIKIDTSGVLTGEPNKLDKEQVDQLRKGMNAVDGDINLAGLRMISLKGLNAEIAKSRTAGTPLPADVQFMAGLQRLEYVIVDKANNDILLAGPGEPWTVNEAGAVVGQNSGTPVLHLEDFLVAMRSANAARQDFGISVSIDPTERGARTLQNFLKRLDSFHPDMAQQVAEAYGPQEISLTGVPKDSRYSQILVAADYKMKRLSMGLEQSPIEDFPSMLELARRKDARFTTAAPRFWMECNYEPVAKAEDNSVWQIRGTGVKTLTEDQYFDKDGQRKSKGKTNKFAKAWADGMTDRFDELSNAEPVFRELRNIMDMSVAAAIIEQEGLLTQVDLALDSIAGQKEQMVSTPVWNVPTTVPAQCSFVRLSRSWIVTASGGVQVDSWSVASNSEVVPAIAKIGTTAMDRTAERWWWNATATN